LRQDWSLAGSPIGGAPTVILAKWTPSGTPSDGSLGSTLNFEVPSGAIAPRSSASLIEEHWRADLLTRVTLDPFRQQRWALSIGGGVFAVGLALATWAIVAIRKAGTRVEASKPTTAIVADGPYKFTRNPIYIGMFLGQAGLAIGFDNLWVLAMLVP